MTRVMQCGVRDEVEVRWQERTEKVKCFRYWEVGHCKWECPNIEVERQKKRSEQAAHVVEAQKAQQERRLAHSTWEKVQEYCDERSIPLEEVLLLERGWIIEETVVTYVECGGCEDKGVQTHENWGQGFLLERQVKNIWYNLCQEVWN